MPAVGTMVCFSLGKGRAFGRVISHTTTGFWIETDKGAVFYVYH